MRNKGFTLMELLAVIIILGVLLTITILSVNSILNDSKKSLSNVQRKQIEAAAEIYHLQEGIKKNEECVDISDLISMGYIESNDVIDPKTRETLPGSVNIKYESYKYSYEYQENSCPISFATDSWETIIRNVKAGKGEKYRVGDEKTIYLGGEFNKNFTVRLANTSTPSECKASNFSQTACGFVVEFVDVISEQEMNSTATNVGGWRDSAMRKYLNVTASEDGSGTVFNALPEELQNAIADTRVISGHGSTVGEQNFVTEDKLYLLSPREVWGNEASDLIDKYTDWENTRQLDYYEQEIITYNYSSAIKKYDGSADYWWLRSAYSKEISHFWRVGGAGNFSSTYANFTHSVAPAFRLS